MIWRIFFILGVVDLCLFLKLLQAMAAQDVH